MDSLKLNWLAPNETDKLNSEKLAKSGKTIQKSSLTRMGREVKEAIVNC